MPTATEVLNEGWKIHQAGDLQRAQAMYEAVAQQAPENANAWCYLGILHFDRNDFAQSESCYRRAIKIQPTFPIAWSNLANSLSAQGRYDEGVQACHTALEQQPGYQTAMNNLGAIYVRQNRFDEAAELFRKAIAANPDNTDAHRNLGAALIRHGDLDDAAEHSQRAVELNPRDADAHKNLGILSLLNGDFESGWREYQWRFQTGDATLPKVPQPMWQGEPLADKTILLAGEQGLGDIIQFARYAQILKDLGASQVVVQCQQALHPLLEELPGCDRLLALGEAVPTDYFIPMMSVPAVLKTHRVEDIPGDVGYLVAQPERIERWRKRLDTSQFLVGVAWQGNPNHNADRQRSAPLRQFAPVAETAGVQLVSLQKGPGVEQLAGVSDWGVVDFGEALDADGAFLDTVALMRCLDLVVTTDTATAHVAGALGVPVWLALCNSPDWRWLLERDDSPWYPSMRLFRQSSPGDWSTVFGAMAGELEPWVTQSGKGVCRSVSIPAAPGELLDKITILRIKQRKLKGEPLQNVERELAALVEIRERTIVGREPLPQLESDLQRVNEALWDIEDQIRDCEREQDFGPRFIELARAVYQQNDGRAALKREINQRLGSQIVEEKSYSDYRQDTAGDSDNDEA